MIIVRNRELIIPRNEAFIGTEYDRDSENRYFKIDRMLPSQIDLAGFTFVLDVVKSSGATDSLATDKEIFDDYLVLRVDMTGLPAGNTRIQLRASDTSGRRWSSAEAVLYVMDSISNPGSVTPSTTLTELEQVETRIEASEAVREASENAREAAETARETAETGRESAESYRVGAENRRDAAEGARVGAEAQRVLNESARQTFESGRVAAESARVAAETAREASFQEKAKLSESWAIGGTGARQGEDTNNSKYYSEQASASAEKAEEERSLQPVIISDYWYIWNPETEQYENTGVKASGDIAEGAVQYNTVQTLTEAEKLVARTNIDAYSKPSSGVPKTDLASEVQDLLEKADASVRYDAPQTLTEAQKEQARNNISAPSTKEIEPLINQWDEQWELGQYSTSTGAKTSDSTRIRCKNLIRVLPNTEYYFKTGNKIEAICTYDADRNFVASFWGSPRFLNNRFTTLSNEHYIAFCMQTSYGTTYNHDISINYPSTYTDYYSSRLVKDEAHIGSIGNVIGMRGWNQLINGAGHSGTVTFLNGKFTYSNFKTSQIYFNTGLALVQGHKYYVKSSKPFNNVIIMCYTQDLTHYLFSQGRVIEDTVNLDIIATCNFTSNNYMLYANRYGATDETPASNYDGYVTMFDLTQMYGAGNEPSSVEEFRAMFPADYYPYCSGGFGDLLWENASPLADFARQTVQLDLSIYRAVRIVYCQYARNDKSFYLGEISQIIDIGSSGVLIGVPTSLCQRMAVVSSTGIEFSDGEYMRTYYDGNSYAVANSTNIPLKIYGLR